MAAAYARRAGAAGRAAAVMAAGTGLSPGLPGVCARFAGCSLLGGGA
ncbi:hypothetical protein BSIN_4852 [Burkholderia singularis]|uniref:Uncharacterized protein n=1 Tax=Burkholderia singularis TaxID=1503053 RepID=A0A238H9Q9_9BURK|nr:hypothetical protein BSIN_4852 [Burkholderia singularis]